MKPTIYLSVMMAVTFLPTGYLFSQDMGVDLTSAEYKIKSASEAMSRALEYTGFGEFKGFTRSLVAPELITINDDKTPFLHDKINGRPIWHIPFMNISINSRTFNSTAKGSDLRKFDVYLDPETGQLLKIISKSSVVDTNIAPEPPAEKAEKQLELNGELYSDFSPCPVSINFRDALHSCIFSNPFKAEEIEALLVMYSAKAYSGYATPKPVWAITLRGIEPRPSPQPIRDAPPLPLYQVNYIRQMIDAKIGGMIFAARIPTVEPRK